MEYTKSRNREILIRVCEQTDGLPHQMEYDYDILAYTFESVSSETADAFYNLILKGDLNNYPIITDLKKRLKQMSSRVSV